VRGMCVRGQVLGFPTGRQMAQAFPGLGGPSQGRKTKRTGLGPSKAQGLFLDFGCGEKRANHLFHFFLQAFHQSANPSNSANSSGALLADPNLVVLHFRTGFVLERRATPQAAAWVSFSITSKKTSRSSPCKTDTGGSQRRMPVGMRNRQDRGWTTSSFSASQTPGISTALEYHVSQSTFREWGTSPEPTLGWARRRGSAFSLIHLSPLLRLKNTVIKTTSRQSKGKAIAIPLAAGIGVPQPVFHSPVLMSCSEDRKESALVNKRRSISRPPRRAFLWGVPPENGLAVALWTFSSFQETRKQIHGFPNGLTGGTVMLEYTNIKKPIVKRSLCHGS